MIEESNQEFIDEIIRLSRRYGIMTPYTTFLKTLPAAEFTEGIVSSKMRAQAQGAVSAGVTENTGENSVLRSLFQKSLREGTSVSEDFDAFFDATSSDALNAPVQNTVRSIKDRTFFFKENTWIDAQHTDAANNRTVAALSTEYFDLMKQHPHLCPFFAVGKKINYSYKSDRINNN